MSMFTLSLVTRYMLKLTKEELLVPLICDYESAPTAETKWRFVEVRFTEIEKHQSLEMLVEGCLIPGARVLARNLRDDNIRVVYNPPPDRGVVHRFDGLCMRGSVNGAWMKFEVAFANG